MRVAELHDGDVDGDADRFRELGRLRAGLAEDPLAERDDQPGLLGERDEVRRRHGTADGVVPAEQRLEPGHLSFREVHEGLVAELELAFGERVAEVGLESPARLSFRVHPGCEEAESAAPFGFGAVQRQIGAFQKRIHVQPVGWRQRDADAHADIERVAVDGERLRHRFDQPLGEHPGSVRLLGADLDDGELVAAEPPDRVLFRQASPDAGGDRLEKHVSDRVAERVVDRLEAVEIETEDGERLARRTEPGERLLEALAQQQAIGELRQGVVPGHMRDMLLHLLARRDVGVGAHRPAVADRGRPDLEDRAVGAFTLDGMEGALERVAAQPFPELLVDLAELAALELVALDVLEAGTGPHQRERQVEELHGATVAHLHAHVAIEHDEALVHVLQGRLEDGGFLLRLGFGDRPGAGPPARPSRRTRPGSG